MTLIVGWLACDQRCPCSAYIASDSRISDNRNFYDNSQKTFALRNTPDILGYCGETLFIYHQIWITKMKAILFLMKLKEYIQHTNLIIVVLKYII